MPGTKSNLQGAAGEKVSRAIHVALEGLSMSTLELPPQARTEHHVNTSAYHNAFC